MSCFIRERAGKPSLHCAPSGSFLTSGQSDFRQLSGRGMAATGANRLEYRRVWRNRADMAMHAYTGALGELREEMQVSHFEAWTLEQLQVHGTYQHRISSAYASFGA